MREEMREYQHLISSHHKEMQELRDLLNFAIQKFDSISQNNVQEFFEFKAFMINQIYLIKEKIIANDTTVSEQKSTIVSLHEQLNEFHEMYASKMMIDKVKKDLDSSIKEIIINHLDSFQEFQREFKYLIQNLQNDLINLRSDISIINGELNKKIDSNFHVSRIDKEGVLNQIRIYEKSMFIIEKKIENIYTLIERINKRGEVCHKQE